MDALFRELDAVFDHSRPREVLEKLDYLWARLALHIRAEHLHLFPALLAASKGGQGGPAAGTQSPTEVREIVKRLREDHDFFMRELAGAVNAARELAALDGPVDAGRLRQIRSVVLAVSGRLIEHNRVEEEQVYLWPKAVLTVGRRAELDAAMRQEIENLPPRFA